MCTLAIYLCLVLLFTGFILFFDHQSSQVNFFAFALCCTKNFSTFIEYFGIISVLINYILTSFVFLSETGFVTELHFTKSYH